MKKDDHEKTIQAILDCVKDELPRLIEEEHKNIIWKEIGIMIDTIEDELDIQTIHHGFIPIRSRLSIILREIKIRKRQL